MNLLLCIEAKRILTRRPSGHTSRNWIGEQLPSLPEALFDELDRTGGREPDEETDSLADPYDLFLLDFAEPMLVATH
ncbi:MAG: hypothetical protein LC131_06205 [Anaerolineae bacterium]|nr:hypothetical protein [Anaerolineae bacterium]